MNAPRRGGRKKRSNGRGRPSTSAGERRGAGKKRARRADRSTDFDAKRVRRERSCCAVLVVENPPPLRPPTALPPRHAHYYTRPTDLPLHPPAASTPTIERIKSTPKTHRLLLPSTRSPASLAGRPASQSVGRSVEPRRHSRPSTPVPPAPTHQLGRSPRAPINLHGPLSIRKPKSMSHAPLGEQRRLGRFEWRRPVDGRQRGV